jgi:hypothetical protein
MTTTASRSWSASKASALIALAAKFEEAADLARAERGHQ